MNAPLDIMPKARKILKITVAKVARSHIRFETSFLLYTYILANSGLFLQKLTIMIPIIGESKRTNPIRRKYCDRFNIGSKHEFNFNSSFDRTLVCAKNQYSNDGTCRGDSGE